MQVPPGRQDTKFYKAIILDVIYLVKLGAFVPHGEKVMNLIIKYLR